MILMRFLILTIGLLASFSNFAQDKTEIEKSIRHKDVPPKAIADLMAILGPDHKVKWYYQEDGQKKVYEAKFIWFSDHYSVEFNAKDAVISNVEIELKLNELEPKFIKRLHKTLDEIFVDNSIRKIQKEYYGKPEELLELISTQVIPKELSVQYEVEVIGNNGSKKALFELILNKKLKPISQRQIKVKSSDIFDY